ncbi:SAM-dependent methyltransferase [Telmatospirillum siberiense]|uniref:SAM-dependent methyltransferase n=2 Tax=Telmatospirillum siberiense TaxID=382514 RepID=A0A2N3Q1X5_9PROT|nr:SAM-dependent methyltransferase [Telmatospirillum siberiense]
MSDFLVFDRHQVRRQRERAAATLGAHDFLLREIGERLADRLSDVTRRFPLALDLGCHSGELGRLLAGRGGIERLVEADLSPAMAARAGHLAVAVDEEALPFAAQNFDLVISNLSLHWVNDLPGCLLQIRHSLKDDGLFLASMLGGETLIELRGCLQEAELEMEGGASPRVSPFADLRDAGALLQRAGFALPVVDVDTITVTYPSPLKLLTDLRGMGETNAVAARRKTFTRRNTLLRALALYEERHADRDGRIPATFQVLTLTAWRPDASQQKPLPPGSGRVPLARALEEGVPRKKNFDA